MEKKTKKKTNKQTSGCLFYVFQLDFTGSETTATDAMDVFPPGYSNEKNLRLYTLIGSYQTIVQAEAVARDIDRFCT